MNHKTFIKFLGLPPLFTSALLLSLLSSCGESTDNQTSGQAGDSEVLSLKKLVIALKANKNPASMLAEKEDLEKYLAEKLNRDVEVIIPTDSGVVVESFRNGTLDLGYLSSTDAARNVSQDTAGILLVHLQKRKAPLQ